jgi:hypothetical protein
MPNLFDALEPDGVLVDDAIDSVLQPQQPMNDVPVDDVKAYSAACAQAPKTADELTTCAICGLKVRVLSPYRWNDKIVHYMCLCEKRT